MPLCDTGFSPSCISRQPEWNIKRKKIKHAAKQLSVKYVINWKSYAEVKCPHIFRKIPQSNTFILFYFKVN